MPATVQNYLESVPENARPQLDVLRSIIKTELPEADEIVSYTIIGYRYKDKVLAYAAGWKTYVSIYPIPRGDTEFQNLILPYKKGKGTLRFPLNKPLPVELITSFIRFHVAERIS